MPKVRRDDVQWVEPQLVAQVRFGEWTHDRHLRHPAYLGIRDDKSAAEVVEERPISERDPQGQARAQALEPRQAVLARRRHHEGRPAQLLPGDRPDARSASEGAAVHDAPLPRRRLREGVLPEGRPVAHARVDPAVPRARLDARASRGPRSGSSSRWSTTSLRCCGWRTWAAST